jgi:xanthosine phosphorylase
MQGRVHFYEGMQPRDLRGFVRTLKRIGCDALLITNAAGSLRPGIGPGSLMAITDHINLMGVNPLAGPNDDSYGPRFPPMDDAYDPALRALLRKAAERLGLTLHEGVYLACLGPSFETPAEIRAFAALGADAVGMSTVPEVIVARHCGMRVAAVSVITNLAAGLGDAGHGHEQTIAHANGAVAALSRLATAFLEAYDREAPLNSSPRAEGPP